jgi:ribosomal protein S19E (S16A)
MANETHSKNYERYKKWYNKGSITREQLEQLVEAGLLTAEEMQEIIEGDNE